MTFEKCNIEQGNIMIAYSDKKLSVGTLTLNPKTQLAKHNRPVLESLHQIKGKCLMKLFDSEDKVEEIELKEGESLDIEIGKFHMHTNPFEEESITLWKASGDITDIIDTIRNSSKM